MKAQTTDQVKLLVLGIGTAIALPFLMQQGRALQTLQSVQPAPREAECVATAELAARPGAWLCPPTVE